MLRTAFSPMPFSEPMPMAMVRSSRMAQSSDMFVTDGIVIWKPFLRASRMYFGSAFGSTVWKQAQ